MLLAVNIGDLVADHGPNVVKVIAILVATMLLAKLVGRFAETLPESVQAQASYLLPKAVWIIGLLILMSALGIDITSLIAIFGVLGVGAALVFTPVGQNAIAGFLAGMDNVVTEGDVITVLEKQGTVIRKGPLSLSVALPDGAVVYMPNLKAIDDELINHSRTDGARIEVEIKLDGAPNKRAAVAIMTETLDDLEWRMQDKPTGVLFTEVGSNAFHYMCQVWIEDPITAPPHRSKMLTALVYALEAAEISVGETGNISASEFLVTSSNQSPGVDGVIDLTETTKLSMSHEM